MTNYEVRNAMNPDVILGIMTVDKDDKIQKYDVEGGKGTGGMFGLAAHTKMSFGEVIGRWRNYTFSPVGGEVQKDAEIEVQAGDIVKIDSTKQHVFGWAYVTHDKSGEVNVDKSGDFSDDIEEIEKTAYKYVLSSRKGDADHTNVETSDMIESIVFTPEKIEKMGIAAGSVPLGWWIGFHVNDKATWERVEKGELRAFSIHGKGTRSKVEE